MAADDFAKALKRRRQISITVTGRRSGRGITIPVWFVADDHALWLLPVNGSKTQWFRNLKRNRALTVQAGAHRQDLRGRLIQSPGAMSLVLRQFREKYTPEQITRWYSGLDVAVQIALPGAAGSER
jgi:deazaflavin-dependent oxidoreductase (nitroreductase family)